MIEPLARAAAQSLRRYCLDLGAFRPVVLLNSDAWSDASGLCPMTVVRPAEALLNLVLRTAFTLAERVRRAFRLITRPELIGAHAIPLTPEGKLVLIKLRYVPGWRLPGGGLKEGEASREAALRELREEIGMIGYSSVELIREGPEQNAFRTGRETVFLVTGVAYRSRWCLEVEAVAEFETGTLPADVSPWTVEAVAYFLNHRDRDS